MHIFFDSLIESVLVSYNISNNIEKIYARSQYSVTKLLQITPKKWNTSILISIFLFLA